MANQQFRLTAARLARMDTRDCTPCHGTPVQRETTYFAKKPMFRDLRIVRPEIRAPQLTWEFVDKLRGLTKAKLVLKGLFVPGDAPDTKRNRGGSRAAPPRNSPAVRRIA